jgi:hypothetical protein
VRALPAPCFLILGAWFLLALALIGVGALFRRACRCPARGAADLLLSAWVGWACVISVLQIWNLVLPVDGRFSILLLVVGLLGLVVGGQAPWRAVVAGLSRKWPPLLALGLVALWLANRALAGPSHGDTGAYFVPVARWLGTYRLVPGLANLYYIFGLNQAYFLHVAMLEVGPLVRQSSHVANGIFVLLLFAQALLGLDRVLRWNRPRTPADLFHALFLPAAVLLGFGIFLTSPSPDLAIFALSVVLSGRFIDLLSRPGPLPAPDFDVATIALLALVGPALKLTFAGLTAALLPMALLVWAVRDRPSRDSAVRTLAVLAATAVLTIGVWMIRGVVVSGCPLFPSHVACFPVPWAADASAVKQIVAPVEAHLSDVVRNPTWGAKRLASIGWGEREVLLPLAIAAAAGVLTILVRLAGLFRGRRTPRLPAYILLPPLTTLMLGFATSPMARYMGATFWLLAVETVLLALGSATFGGRRWVVAVTCAASLGLALLPFFGDRAVLSGLTELQPMSVPQVEEVRLASGLLVRVPRTTCGDAPLPCTPAPDPALRLRRDGDLSSGFVLDRSARAR